MGLDEPTGDNRLRRAVSERAGDDKMKEDELRYDPRIHRMPVVNGDQERFYSSILPVDQQTCEDDTVRRCSTGHRRRHEPSSMYNEMSRVAKNERD